MERLQEIEVDEVLKYLKKNIQECVYLYIDVSVYRLKNPNMTVWINKKEGQLNTVVMKYFDSFQIFSAYDDWDEQGVLDLILEHGVTTVLGKKSMIERLFPKLNDIYTVAYGIVVKEDKYKDFKQFDQIEQAAVSDVREIAELMCTDEEFSSNYTVEILAQQLEDRMKTGMGRNFIIRKEGRIVAHVGVFAETEDVAVESGLIVSKDAGKNLYGLIIHEFIKKQLISEGKEVFAFRIKDSMIRCTKVAHVGTCLEYGKMTKENHG